MARLRYFVPITKIDEELRLVSGIATREEIDKQGEIVAYEGSKKAFASWTDAFEKATGGLSLGNVREMHQPSAAGKVCAWDAVDEEQAIHVTAKVVDDDAWEKCRERVYTGFSVGGNPTREVKEKRNGKRVNVVKEYELVEVSLVDNPACPSATFSVVKRAIAAPADGEAGDPKPGAAGVHDDPPPGTAKRDPTTIQTLIFDKDKFSDEEAKSWARDHEFKAAKSDVTQDSIRLRQRDPGDFKDGSFRTIELKDGVKAVVGHLKIDWPARLRKSRGRLLQKYGIGAELPRSEAASLYPAISALQSIVAAMDSEYFEMAMNPESAEEEKADCALLISAAESILEFIYDELQEEIRGLTAADGEVMNEALEALNHLFTLAKSLTPKQLAKVLKDEDMAANLQAMHKMGHAMTRATYAMGAECKAMDEDLHPPKDDGDDADDEGDGKDDGDKKEAVAHGSDHAGPGGGPDNGSDHPDEENPRQHPKKSHEAELTKVLEKLDEVLGKVKEGFTSIDGRVKKIEKSPAPIGRPAAAAEKSLPGGAPATATITPDIEAAILAKHAESLPPSSRKDVLLKAAALTIQSGPEAGKKAA